jgi:hypothetical protein
MVNRDFISLGLINDLLAKGYNRLLPIAPREGAISPASTLTPANIGKVPGYKNGDDSWHSFPWAKAKPSETEMQSWARWEADKAGIGILGVHTPALDIDVTSAPWAVRFTALAHKLLGVTPTRTGNAPKVILPYRSEHPLPHRKLKFWLPDEPADSPGHLIELIGAGRFWVSHGIHKDTGKPYIWSVDLPRHEDLPAIDLAMLDAYLEACKGLLRDAGASFRSEKSSLPSDRDNIPQGPLAAPSLDVLRAVVEETPNTNANFSTRSKYIAFATAIKAASGPVLDDILEAEEIFTAWALSWEGSDRAEADINIIKGDWERIKGPYQIGFPALLAMAEEAGSAPAKKINYSGAVGDFSPLPDDPAALLPTPKRTGLYAIDYADIKPILEQRFVIDGILAQESLGMLFGGTNMGKTFVGSDMSLRGSAGLPWFGRDTTAGLYLYVASEAGLGINKRVEAWRVQNGLLVPGERLPFAVVPCGVNLLDPRAHAQELIDLIRRKEDQFKMPAMMVTIDTLSRAMAGGNENDSTDAGGLIMNIDRIRQAVRAAFLLIHHEGKDAGKGARGHSLIKAAVDTEIHLTRNDSGLGCLTITKQRDMETGKPLFFSLRPVIVFTDAQGKTITSCVVEQAEGTAAQFADADLADEMQEIFLAGLSAKTGEKVALSHSRRAGDGQYAPRVIAEMKLSAVATEALLFVAMNELITAGKVEKSGKLDWLTKAYRPATGLKINEAS